MSKGTLGSFNGVVTPNINMLDVFKREELKKHQNSILSFSSKMIIRKLGIQCPAGTEISINGCDIPIISGVFELGFGQIDVSSLIFKDSVSVNIYYMY